MNQRLDNIFLVQNSDLGGLGFYSYLTHIKDSNIVFRESYIHAPVLLNLSNKLWKRDKMLGLPVAKQFIFFTINFTINSNTHVQEHGC